MLVGLCLYSTHTWHFTEKRKADMTYASQNLLKARERAKQQFIRRYHNRVKEIPIEPGMMVLVRNATAENTVTQVKMLPRYIGPYVIDKITPRGNYRLSELDGTPLAKPIAQFRVLPYFDRRTPEIDEILDTIKPPSDDENTPNPQHASTSPDVEDGTSEQEDDGPRQVRRRLRQSKTTIVRINRLGMMTARHMARIVWLRGLDEVCDDGNVG